MIIIKANYLTKSHHMLKQGYFYANSELFTVSTPQIPKVSYKETNISIISHCGREGFAICGLLHRKKL